MIDRLTDTTITERDVINKMKRRDRLLTTLLWIVYLYLWMPFISLVAWYFGIDFAYEKVIKAGGVESLADILIAFAQFLGVIMIFVLGWSLNQRLRFAKKDRRKTVVVTDPEAEMAAWDIDESLFEIVRNARVMTLSIDENERLSRVQSRR